MVEWEGEHVMTIEEVLAFEEMQIFDRKSVKVGDSGKEVQRILGCSSSIAGEIMSKLREMKVIHEVKGKGKGKYRFANRDEVKIVRDNIKDTTKTSTKSQ